MLEYRLKNEYGVYILMQMQPYEVARWLVGDNITPETLKGAERGMFVYDVKERPVLLVTNEWALGWIADNNPDIKMLVVPEGLSEK